MPSARRLAAGGGSAILGRDRLRAGQRERPLDRLAAHRVGAKPLRAPAVVGEQHRQLRLGLESRLDEVAAASAVAGVVVDEDPALDATADQDTRFTGEA